MNKYIGYARVATQEQGDASSLNRQIDKLHEYANANSIEIEEVISEVGSGVSIDRDGIKSLLNKLSTGQYKGVLFTRIDRLSRNFTNFLVFQKFMEEKGMEIITTEETFVENPRNSPIEKFTSTILSAVAEYNRTLMSERIKAGIKKAKLERKNVFANQKQN